MKHLDSLHVEPHLDGRVVGDLDQMRLERHSLKGEKGGGRIRVGGWVREDGVR
jgi:hypothetical protein